MLNDNLSILILGKNGFIGNAVFQEAVKMNFDCTSADITPYSQNTAIDYTLDSNVPDIFQILSKKKVDVVINCTGAANVGLSYENPLNDFSLNVMNVYRFLDQIRLSKQKVRFINISSAAVYGNTDSLPIQEDSESSKYVSPYGLNKKLAEEVLYGFNKLFSLETFSLRAFSVYGSGLKKQLFWDIAKKISASQNNTITLSGTGEETRDFIHVSDFAKAALLIAAHKNPPQIVNVASGISVKIRDAATILLNNIRPNFKLIFDGKVKAGDPRFWQADTERLSEMGFQTKIKIEDGLSDYAQWVRKELSL